MVNAKVTLLKHLVLIMFIATGSIAGAQKLSAKIDLAIIGPVNSDQGFINAFKESIKDLPNVADIGPDKVRVAIVEPFKHATPDEPGATLWFEMSDDKAKLENWLNNWQAVTTGHNSYWHSAAYKLLREQVFNVWNPSRAKMVIQVMNGWTKDKDKQNAFDETKKLRDMGVIIYVIYSRAWHLASYPLIDYAREYVGADYNWRMVPTKYEADHKAMFINALKDILELTTEITRDLCTFCHFKDTNQTQCSPTTRPKESDIDFFGDMNARCGAVDATAIPCPLKECEFECDRQWAWTRDDPGCDLCGDIHREGKMPPKLDNCRRVIKCQPCPTTKPAPKTTKKTTTAPLTMGVKIKKDQAGLGKLEIILISVGCSIGALVVIIVAALIVARNRSAADRQRAEDMLKLKIEQRKADKAKHKHRVIQAGVMAKGRQDSMAVSLMSTRDQSKVARSKVNKSPIKKRK